MNKFVYIIYIKCQAVAVVAVVVAIATMMKV